jgi:hypothetical protein
MSLVVSRIFLPAAYLHRKAVISTRILMFYIIGKTLKNVCKENYVIISKDTIKTC